MSEVRNLKKIAVLLLLIPLLLFLACDDSDDDDGAGGGTPSGSSSSGIIRNDDDAQIIGSKLNSVLETIRDSMSYGNTYTDYTPVEGGYVLNGGAWSGPIFSGSYTTEYEKTFTVVFDDYTDSNGLSIISGTIDYDFTDYSSSGYHLIIEVSGETDIEVACQNGAYKIEDTLSNLLMGDTSDNQYMIWAAFYNSEGVSYSVDTWL